MAPTPSNRYRQLMALYARLHLEGDAANKIPPERVFDGRNLAPQVENIALICRRMKAKSIIDYGCGKAGTYVKAEARFGDGNIAKGLLDIWNVDAITLYDPALREYARLPSAPADGVICTAVLEMTPEEDVEWVIEELFSLAKKFVFLTIASYPSHLTLPTGDNYHPTLKEPGWWTDRLLTVAKRTPGVKLFAALAVSDTRLFMLEG